MSPLLLLSPQTISLARRWLLLGVTALGLAGIFSVLLVLARSPAFKQLGGFIDFFHVALVVHVDLSVLVWFLAMACLLWSLLGQTRAIPYLSQTAFSCFAAGTLLIAGAPLMGQGEALMSNYIPVLTNPIFFIGLGLLMAGTLLALLNMIMAKPATGQSAQLFPFASADMQNVQRLGIYSSGLIAFIALACFMWSGWLTPRSITGQEYYEMVFWAGGHVLQFTHTQLMMVAWVGLANLIGYEIKLEPDRLSWLYLIGWLAALTSPLAYLFYDITSYEHGYFFTLQMIIGGAIAPSVLFCFITAPLLRTRKVEKEWRALWSSLAMSLLLFAVGGLIGLAIEGENVTIPAHYHGSIVGVTLAFMGLAYALLPQLSYENVASWRMAFWQPILYGGGQLLHIVGLTWSGGYGVLRKTPGGIDSVSVSVKAAMGLMGLGGLLAILGGLLFVIVVIRSIQLRPLPQA